MSSETSEIVQEALDILNRYIDVAEPNECRELAVQIKDRFASKSSDNITEEEIVLLRGLTTLYNHETGLTESDRLHETRMEHMTDDTPLKEKLSDWKIGPDV